MTIATVDPKPAARRPKVEVLIEQSELSGYSATIYDLADWQILANLPRDRREFIDNLATMQDQVAVMGPHGWTDRRALPLG